MRKETITGTLSFRITPEWIFPLEQIKLGQIVLDCFEDSEVADFDYKVVYELEDYEQYHSDVHMSETLTDEKSVTYYMVYDDGINYVEEQINDEFLIEQIENNLNR